jgi:hypothetical protein
MSRNNHQQIHGKAKFSLLIVGIFSLFLTGFMVMFFSDTNTDIRSRAAYPTPSITPWTTPSPTVALGKLVDGDYCNYYNNTNDPRRTSDRCSCYYCKGAVVGGIATPRRCAPLSPNTLTFGQVCSTSGQSCSWNNCSHCPDGYSGNQCLPSHLHSGDVCDQYHPDYPNYCLKCPKGSRIIITWSGWYFVCI